MARPLIATILKPAPAPRPGFDAETAADLLRSVLIDRLDAGFLGGEIDELLTNAATSLQEHGLALRDLGFDRLDVLRAFQNDLFPEAFLPPEHWDDTRATLVPPKGGGGAGTGRMLALVQDIWAQPAPQEKRKNH